MTCKGICIQYKATLPVGHAGRYADGQSRCQPCMIFIKTDGLYCPCCGHRLRKMPRHKFYKEKFREKKNGQ